MLFDCTFMASERSRCGINSFINDQRSINPSVSSVKLYALYLSDRDPKALPERSLSLYSMMLAWHKMLGMDI